MKCLSLSFMFLLISVAKSLTIDIDLSSFGPSCSRQCESSFCAIPPLLKYGKYCGFEYTGCPGEPPCDGLDACCMAHDACIDFNNGDLLNEGCNERFLECLDGFRNTDGQGFGSSTCNVLDVEASVYHVIEAALLTRRVIGRP